MKIDAQMICNRTPAGVICHWQGGSIAEISHEAIRAISDIKRITFGDTFNVGRLRVRVVAPTVFHGGMPFDTAAVMLESPHAQLFQLYREKAERFIGFAVNVEARLRAAWRGLRLRPFPEGEIMPFAAWLADRLL